MTVELNHTIVHVKDRWAAAREVGGVLGLPEAQAYGPFAELKLGNAVSLDFMDTEGEIHGQHYAFLVSEEEFDLVLGRFGTTAARGGPIRTSGSRTRSTTATAAGVCTGRDPTATGWRSSPVLTAAERPWMVSVTPWTACSARSWRGRRPAATVLEDEDFVGFLDHRPVFKGHVLLVPRVHLVTLPDLPAGLRDGFLAHAQRLATAMVEGLGAQGSFVAMNNTVSQSVPHLHLHVVPRTKGDGLRGFFWPRTKYADDAEIAAYADRLRAALA